MRGRNGFSLVEMVVALSIFSIAIVALLGVFTTCLRSTGLSVNQTRATLLAQGLMEGGLAQDITTAQEGTGEFGEEFPGATWQIEIAETDTSDLYEVHVTVSWPERGVNRTFELTSLAVAQ